MFEFDTKIIYPKDPTATPERIKQYKEYYKVKYNICKNIAPRRIVEIGVRAGYSAWSFLQACPESEYIGIDANNGTHGGAGGQDGRYSQWAKKILSKYNCNFIELNTQNCDNLNLSNVDLFHVDGDHTEKGVIHDLTLAYNTLSDNGNILVDDIEYIKEVKDGVSKWLLLYSDKIKYEYIQSFRGECLITKL